MRTQRRTSGLATLTVAAILTVISGCSSEPKTAASTDPATTTTIPALSGAATTAIYFGPNSSGLTETAKTSLQGVADEIVLLPAKSVVRIVGWSSPEGNAKRNSALSLARAQAVENELRELIGTQAAQLTFEREGRVDSTAISPELARKVTFEIVKAP